MPHLGAMVWNQNDELLRADDGGGASTYFQYAGGQRIRKRWVGSGATPVVKERIYLGGWELHRHFNGAGVLQGKSVTNRPSPPRSQLA